MPRPKKTQLDETGQDPVFVEGKPVPQDIDGASAPSSAVRMPQKRSKMGIDAGELGDPWDKHFRNNPRKN